MKRAARPGPGVRRLLPLLPALLALAAGCRRPETVEVHGRRAHPAAPGPGGLHRVHRRGAGRGHLAGVRGAAGAAGHRPRPGGGPRGAGHGRRGARGGERHRGRVPARRHAPPRRVARQRAGAGTARRGGAGRLRAAPPGRGFRGDPLGRGAGAGAGVAAPAVELAGARLRRHGAGRVAAGRPGLPGARGDEPRILVRDAQTGRILATTETAAGVRSLDAGPDGTLYALRGEGRRATLAALRPGTAGLEGALGRGPALPGGGRLRAGGGVPGGAARGAGVAGGRPGRCGCWTPPRARWSRARAECWTPPSPPTARCWCSPAARSASSARETPLPPAPSPARGEGEHDTAMARIIRVEISPSPGTGDIGGESCEPQASRVGTPADASANPA